MDKCPYTDPDDDEQPDFAEDFAGAIHSLSKAVDPSEFRLQQVMPRLV